MHMIVRAFARFNFVTRHLSVTMSMKPEVSDVSIERLQAPRFVKPFSLKFKLAGKQKRWELLKVHSAVAIMLYNRDQDRLVFVRQFRPAIFIQNYIDRHGIDIETFLNDQSKQSLPLEVSTEDTERGMTMELCAGIIDRNESPLDIAVAEVFEETGYTISKSDLIKVGRFRSGVGTAGSFQNIYYAEVTDSMRTGDGGGIASEGERIEVLHLSLEEADQMAEDESIEKPLAVIYAIQWRKLKMGENSETKQKCSKD